MCWCTRLLYNIILLSSKKRERTIHTFLAAPSQLRIPFLFIFLFPQSPLVAKLGWMKGWNRRAVSFSIRATRICRRCGRTDVPAPEALARRLVGFFFVAGGWLVWITMCYSRSAASMYASSSNRGTCMCMHPSSIGRPCIHRPSAGHASLWGCV
jgi:hypothetical protein